MDNYVAISELNPTSIVKQDRALIPQYNTKFSDEWLDPETRMPWQTYGRYYQKWQTNDIITWQFISNVAPLKALIYDCKMMLIQTLIFTQKQQNRYLPGMYIYEASLSLVGYTPGRYKIKYTVGDPVLETLEDDYIDVAEKWENTVLIQYKNSRYYGDAIFATGWAPSFRVEGWFKQNAPGSKDEMYIDQVYNSTMLYSDPFKTRKFIIGPSSGVPEWTPDKLIWILGCDDVTIDGKAFTKVEGAKFTEEEIKDHPFMGWSIDLQDAKRRPSRVFPVDPSIGGKKLLVALNVDTQGFADTTLGSSSNVIQITNVDTAE